jgi:5,10-methylenetetrahydrofolate reductase
MNTLQERLESRQFVVTTELEPPKGTDLSSFLATAAQLKGKVDAINVTDNQRATMRLSSVGGASVLAREGLEPILQLTCRDRNRMALQSDLLAAWVLGIRNVITMTGDPVDAGDHPMAKPVFDVSSTVLLQMIGQLNSGKDAVGNPLEGHTDFFCGATVNPCVEPLEPKLKRFEEKVQAGARFFQTQAIYDLDAFDRFMKIAKTMSVYIIAGVIPLRSVKMAHFLNEKVPGIQVPAAMIDRLDGSTDPIETGLAIAGEIVAGLKDTCQGIHLMPVGKEKDFTILERLALVNATQPRSALPA